MFSGSPARFAVGARFIPAKAGRLVGVSRPYPHHASRRTRGLIFGCPVNDVWKNSATVFSAVAGRPINRARGRLSGVERDTMTICPCGTAAPTGVSLGQHLIDETKSAAVRAGGPLSLP